MGWRRVSISVFLVFLAALWGYAGTAEYEEQTRRLYTFLKDYRAREHARRRDAAVHHALGALRRALEAPRTTDSTGPSDYDTAWFVCSALNAQKGLLPPDIEDRQELKRVLDAAALESPGVLRTLIGVGLLWNGQTVSAAYELGQLKVELPAGTQRWASSSVAAQELFRMQIEPPVQGAFIGALCQAWVFSELRLPLYAEAALANAEKIRKTSGGAEAEAVATAMFRTAIAVVRNDWATVRSSVALVRKHAQDCPLDRLASFTLGIQEHERVRTTRREPDAPFSLETHPLSVDELDDEWLAERLEYHLGNANQRMVLWSVARDGSLWLRALMLSLVRYADGQETLHPMRDWLLYGGRLGELMVERTCQKPPSEDGPRK